MYIVLPFMVKYIVFNLNNKTNQTRFTVKIIFHLYRKKSLNSIMEKQPITLY